MLSRIGVFRHIVNAPKESELPSPAILYIGLKSWSENNGDGTPLLTPQLISEKEIDWWVDALKKELDHVARIAKGALKRANEKTQRRVAGKRR